MEGGIFKKYASYLKQQPRNHISTIAQPNYGQKDKFKLKYKHKMSIGLCLEVEK